MSHHTHELQLLMFGLESLAAKNYTVSSFLFVVSCLNLVVQIRSQAFLWLSCQNSLLPGWVDWVAICLAEQVYQ